MKTLKETLADMKLRLSVLVAVAGMFLAGCGPDVESARSAQPESAHLQGVPWQRHILLNDPDDAYSTSIMHRLPNGKGEVLCVFARYTHGSGGLSCDWVGLHKAPEVKP